jgi:hypothetical protein
LTRSWRAVSTVLASSRLEVRIITHDKTVRGVEDIGRVISFAAGLVHFEARAPYLPATFAPLRPCDIPHSCRRRRRTTLIQRSPSPLVAPRISAVVVASSSSLSRPESIHFDPGRARAVMSSTATLTQNHATQNHTLLELRTVGSPHPQTNTNNGVAVESGPFSSSSSSLNSDKSPLLRKLFKPLLRPSHPRSSNRMATSLSPPCRWDKSDLDAMNAVFDSEFYLKQFPGVEEVQGNAKNGRLRPPCVFSF